MRRNCPGRDDELHQPKGERERISQHAEKATELIEEAEETVSH
ncbi:hypothetical protein BH20VER1_BH20VER1_06470 [soil metagenome]